MDDILSKEVGFCAIQVERQGNDNWERVKRCITCQLLISDYYPLTCTPFIRVQVGIADYLLKSIIELPPRYTEEPRKFALRHGNFSISFADDLHIAAPFIITALFALMEFYFYLWFVLCIHAVSSMLLFLPVLAIAIAPMVIASVSIVSFSLFFS